MDTFGEIIGGIGATALLFAYIARKMVELSYRASIGHAKVQVERLATQKIEQVSALEAASREVFDKREALRKLERQASQRAKDLAELRQQGEVLVHLVGERSPGSRLFSCELAFSRNRASKGLRGILSLPTVWSYPNLVEAWAEDEGEAVRLLDATFPKSAGFRLSKFQEVKLD